MRLGRRLLDLFFPPKCVFCRRILPENETELCRACRDRYLSDDVPDVRRGEPSFSVCDSAVYYEDAVAASFKRFKFGGMQSYAACYGRLLAMTVLRRGREFDVLTYVPISDRRRRRRGYDQARLLAKATAKTLGMPLTPTLYKQRNTQPQSGTGDAAKRRANITGAYRMKKGADVTGKRVLLIDDIHALGVRACARQSGCGAGCLRHGRARGRLKQPRDGYD